MATDVAPHNMTAADSPSPYVVTESSFYPDHPGWKCFDGELGSQKYWITNVLAGGTGWVKIDFGSGNSHKIGAYAIQCNSIPEPNRMPSAWTLQGSNDDSNWDTLDTVTGQTEWGSSEKREYTCDVITTAYRYIKIDVTANNGDTFLIIGEVYLYEASGPPMPVLLAARRRRINQ